MGEKKGTHTYGYMHPRPVVASFTTRLAAWRAAVPSASPKIATRVSSKFYAVLQILFGCCTVQDKSNELRWKVKVMVKN